MKKSNISVPAIMVCLVFNLTFQIVKAQSTTERNIAPGKFQPNWESFQKNYQCPEWFRDAKFGIWAHWSAQCVPEEGDWYARHMYIQGWGQYNHHLAKYGHPSVFGFMEFDNLWKAEKWNPDSLIMLYKKAGAQYFVALANHHDNFDAYDSKYHAWNSVNIGPKKDIIGTWEKLARKNGLRFGVSNHSAHAWHWMQTAYGYDAEGPKAGVRYDAYTLTKADGKGKWWEGLDPQDLYTGPTMVAPDGIKSAKEMAEWHDKNDRAWDENPPAKNPKFTETWYLRCQDLVDKYRPDLLYFDDFGLPLGQTGLDIVAHYYNSSLKWNGQMPVVNAKQLAVAQKAGIVEDVERGFSDNIQPHPWQTCTCIGDWHYNRHTYQENRYKSVKQVVYSLIEIVSKNGNLLLSVPMKGDGSIDDLEIAFLKGMESWMNVNGPAIFGSRPWKSFGEGPTHVSAGMFGEGSLNFKEKDFRFTSKGDTLFAFAFGWPSSGKLVIRSLASDAKISNAIKDIKLLGSNEKITWSQTGEGLTVNLPGTKPCEHAYVFRILPGKGGLKPNYHEEYLLPEQHDSTFVLSPSSAIIKGSSLRVEGSGNLGYWTAAADYAYWNIDVKKAGKYNVFVKVAAQNNSGSVAIQGAESKTSFNITATGGWQTYETKTPGAISLKGGKQKLTLKSDDASGPNANILMVKLVLEEVASSSNAGKK